MNLRSEEHLAAQAIEARAFDEALRLLIPLAERDSEYALLALGWIHETGVVDVPDLEAARLYYERAAAHGSADALHYLGWLHWANGRDSEARTAFATGANLGDEECTSAITQLGNSDIEWMAAKALESGAFKMAQQILTPLAERNSNYALVSLGWIYETGSAGPADKDLALSYYERAAALGNAPAYFHLGRLLHDFGKQGEAKAAFDAGARAGDIPCMARLGRLMIERNGGTQETEKGTLWLERAAASGHIMAKRALLGIEYRNAPNLYRKIAVKLKILALVQTGAREMIKDHRSYKVR
jgi:uncharacterized protein